jgi:hypothetical protein
VNGSFLECFAPYVFLFNDLKDLSVHDEFLEEFELLCPDHRNSLLFGFFNLQWLKFFILDIIKLNTESSLKRRILFDVFREIILSRYNLFKEHVFLRIGIVIYIHNLGDTIVILVEVGVQRWVERVITSN